jgi:solute carrier family 25 carnitine/acylcarnitine transporter 20/29
MSQKGINDTLAGSAAGIAQVLTSQPLDTIKTRAQIAPSASFNATLRVVTD